MLNTTIRNAVKSVAGFVGWAVSDRGNSAYPVFNTDARASLRAALLGSSLDADLKTDLTLLVDAQTEDVRLAWDLARNAAVTSFNGGALGPMPTFAVDGVDVATMTQRAIAHFDLAHYITVTQVSGAVQFGPTNVEIALAKSAGFVIVLMHDKPYGHANISTVMVAGISRQNFHGFYVREGGATNQWLRNVTSNIDERRFINGTADLTFETWLTAFGLSNPSLDGVAYSAALWGDAGDTSFHRERNGRRPTLQSALRVYGMPVVPADQSFTLVADADLTDSAAGYGSLRGTWDIPMSAIKIAATQAAHDPRAIAETSAAERTAAINAADSLADDGSVWRLTVTEPFTVPMIGTWHSDLAGLPVNEVFIPQYGWTRKKWDDKFAGKLQSLFAAMIMTPSSDVPYVATVADEVLSVTAGGSVIDLADVPQYSSLLASSESVASAVEAALEVAGRTDLVVITEDVDVTSEIGNVPLFSFVPANRGSAERFIALKADVRSVSAERMLLSTVWASLQAGKRFFG